MHERWYKRAIVYCLDVQTFQDSNGEGIGDLAGLTSRLDYPSRLGVTCLWLNPIHRTSNPDDGYDVTSSTATPTSARSATSWSWSVSSSR